MTQGVVAPYTIDMEENKKEKVVKTIEDSFVTYDPDNLPCMKLCTCDIIRELPELSAEDIAGFQDK